MPRSRVLILPALLLTALFSLSHAQEQPAPPAPAPQPAPQPAGGDDIENIDVPSVIAIPTPTPPTKLEALLAKPGVLIVKGFTEVGGAQGEANTGVRVFAVEIKAGDEKALGVAIQIHQGTRTAVSYIDVDELTALSTAMTDIAKLERNATTLDAFEANFRTKGNLELLNRNIDGNRAILLRATQLNSTLGIFQRSTAMFTISSFSQVRAQINNATETVNRIPG